MSISQEKAPKKILVIDDEPHIVSYLEALLQDNGYTTSSASNGAKGMEEVKRFKPDLVCLDITMPEQSGLRFYRNLKEDPEYKSVPVVIVTAVTGLGGNPEPFKQFVNTRRQFPAPEAFFSKPIDRKEFIESIGQILA